MDVSGLSHIQSIVVVVDHYYCIFVYYPFQRNRVILIVGFYHLIESPTLTTILGSPSCLYRLIMYSSDRFGSSSWTRTRFSFYVFQLVQPSLHGGWSQSVVFWDMLRIRFFKTVWIPLRSSVVPFTEADLSSPAAASWKWVYFVYYFEYIWLYDLTVYNRIQNYEEGPWSKFNKPSRI